MQLWSLIVDSLRESLDRKIFWVMIALTFLVTLTMASVGFDGDEVSFLFGWWSAKSGSYNPLTELGRSHLLGFMIYYVNEAFVWWIGVTLMIIATAGAMPSFLERGAVDVVLAKPIGRARLFLYKYLAGMVFVAVQAGVFFGLTFLVMGVRWGVWSPGYLMSAVLLVLLFSYLYCVSVFVAVKTRSAVASILLTILAWVMFAAVHQAPAVFDVVPSLKEKRTLYAVVRAASWIPPKTGDFPYLAARWAKAGTSIDSMPLLPAEMSNDPQFQQARDAERQELEKSQVLSIGSSLLFEAVIVLWAMWSFARKDY